LGTGARPPAAHASTRLANLLLAVALAGCTSIGVHDQRLRQQIDFGARDDLALCLYLDEGISEDRARALIGEAWRDEAPLFGLDVRVASVVRWKRPAYTMGGIVDGLRREPLGPGCDRVLALIGRHLGDVLWGLLPLPEVLGAVNDETLTHGYVIAERATLNQLFMPPAAIIRHELYHLLGCDAHFQMGRCYAQIAALKRWKRERGSDFLPSWDLINQCLLPTRDAVNARLAAVLHAEAVPAVCERPFAGPKTAP
jgi:hypothetical protein